MLLYLVLGLTVYILVRILCKSWYTVIMLRYETQAVYDYTAVPLKSTRFLLAFLQVMSEHSAALWITIAEFIGVLRFVRHRFLPETAAVHTALEYMTLGDLSHEQAFAGSDEIGELAIQAEALRHHLTATKRDEWELQKEQKSINSAFAHDMRTPLTVMKGYTEFLIRFVPEGKLSQDAVLDRLHTILAQQERLLEFSKTMSEIQNIEMWELHCIPVDTAKLADNIRSMTVGVAKLTDDIRSTDVSMPDNRQTFDMSTDADIPEVLMLDHSLVMEVCENLVSNAVRYANSHISVRLSFVDDKLIVYVADDGPGFSANGLKQAASLYYTESDHSDGHFGMGLYICSKLCEKHGGSLQLINKINGGAVISAEFKSHICD